MQEYVQPEIDTDGNIVYSVEECVFLINEAVARLGMVRVRGEISSLSLSKGIMAFFDLKDAGGKESVVQCSLFGWNFSKYKHLLEDGMEVVIRGHLKVYEKRGTLSLIVESMEPSGEGAWRRAFEALKKKLEAKGYFEKSRKREIPEFVQKIGLITSEDGQALHDFQKNLGNYGFQVYLRSVWVEGDKAEKSIVRAFQWFNKNQTDIDVLVLMRGGGGFENLKVFHSEEIAGEIVSSRIPVITGIGHEKDESIADYAADLWLSTPTAVAAYLTQQREELIRSVDAIWEDVSEKIVQLFEAKNIAIQTDAAALRIATERVFERSRYTLTSTVEKLYYLYEREFQNAKSRVEKAWVALTSLNPENVLQRGYSVVFNEQGLVLKNARDTSIGDKVFVRLHKGKLGTRVEEKK